MKDTTLTANPDADNYHAFLESMDARFQTAKGPFFITYAPNIWDTFFMALAPEVRQSWQCNCCRKFIESFGTIVEVDAAGYATSPFWDTKYAPPELHYAVVAVMELLSKAPVEGPLVSKASVLGSPVSGGFRHLHINLAQSFVFKSKLETEYQEYSKQQEAYKTLTMGLAAYPVKAFEEALRVLTTGAIAQSEKFVAWARWLLTLKKVMTDKKLGATRRTNSVWKAMADTPAGWTHIKSGMLGTLLDDIESGRTFEDVKARWGAKMSPLQYQRPTEAPKAQAIEKAETIFKTLGLESALARRFAYPAECEFLWLPKGLNPPKEGGIFGNVKARNQKTETPGMEITTPPMTFRTFQEDHLPGLTAMEVFVPTNINNDFVGFLTAVNADAERLFKWNNQVSWYRPVYGSGAMRWMLSPGTWVKVVGICDVPSNWGGCISTYKEAIFLLEGCKDTQCDSLCLFPECLRSELHGVRAVLESYSNSGKLTPMEGEAACGLSVAKGITVRSGATTYQIRGLK